MLDGSLAVSGAAMSRDEIFAKMQELLKEILALESTEPLTLDAHLRDDLAADSLAMVDIIIAVEESFGLKIKTDIDFYEDIATVGDAVDMIVNLSSDAN